MRAIRKVLSTLPYAKAHKLRLQEIFEPAQVVHCRAKDDVAIRNALEDAEVAVISGDVDARYLGAPRLEWVHCDKAGIENSASPAVFERGLIVTSSAGRSAPALAEHVLFFMLALAYHFPEFYRAQDKHQWGIQHQGRLRALRGSCVGILGMGHITRALLPLIAALSMTTIVYRRRTGTVEGGIRVLARDNGDKLEDFIGQCDFLVLACSLNDSTRHIIDRNAFGAMKSTARLINIARGALVDEQALLEALTSERIAGADLDTFSVEPLPEDSPLWDAPNILITPHFTPPLADRTERSLEIIADNKRRFVTGETMLNRLTTADMYQP
jgi:phosphoglycerate dehydrogenase-like enzyme